MYAKIKNEQVLKFPYDIMDLFQECPETKGYGCDIISLFASSEFSKKEGSQIVPVEIIPMPEYDRMKQVYTNQMSISFVNNSWVANYVIRDYTPQEIDEFESRKQPI